ncbi:unnamed protein product [Schistosoma mattheei]|uniref:Uncharacterized protein n=1 Tax=Schistosoma mattheei TaxID=31246 RepID=A0AA85B2G3_9TREM|nr:unnamed protein product [Schistosoma mattheei]
MTFHHCLTLRGYIRTYSLLLVPFLGTILVFIRYHEIANEVNLILIRLLICLASVFLVAVFIVNWDSTPRYNFMGEDSVGKSMVQILDINGFRIQSTWRLYTIPGFR